MSKKFNLKTYLITLVWKWLLTWLLTTMFSFGSLYFFDKILLLLGKFFHQQTVSAALLWNLQ